MTTKIDLQQRTKAFHISVINVCKDLPKSVVGYELSKQLIRSAGSVGANYRAVTRAKSTSDFIYKLQIVIEEADESKYWLEICEEALLILSDRTQPLIKEANELTSIFVSSVKTTKNKNSNN